MRTNILKKLTGTFAFFLCLVAGLNAKAQMANPYQIQNQLTCAWVAVSWQFTKSSCSGPCTGPGASGSCTIAANSFTNIPTPAGCGPNSCNIQITLYSVGGTAVGPIQVGGYQSPNPNSTACSGCASGCPTTVNIDWATSAATKIY